MARKGRKPPQRVPLLHIYGQESWHDSVVVVGNKAALEILLQAIKTALKTGRGNSETVYPADREGYGVIVLQKNGEVPEDWGRLALPYTNEIARDKREDALRPVEVSEAEILFVPYPGR